MYDRENPTTPKLSPATGHRYIGKLCPGKPQTISQWNFKTKSFDQVPQLYNYCIDCKQFGWGMNGYCKSSTLLSDTLTDTN